MSRIIIPVELTKEALRYIEEHSCLTWISGNDPTDYIPNLGDDYKYLSLRCGRLTNGRMVYGAERGPDDKLYEFNELDQFIKGYERRKICQT